MQRVLRIASGIALVLLLVVLMRLASLEEAGPSRHDLVIGGETPATFYLPGQQWDGRRLATARLPPHERVPAVVLTHGFASDRRNMSPLARSLARAGYAVLALDVAGHGESRRSLGIRGGRADRSGFFEELDAAVLWLRASELVDDAHIIMMGHSMGADASLGYGSWDPTVDGLVMIAGGWGASGPYRPRNALFLYAEGDPPRLRDGVRALVAELAGRELPDGEVAGDFERGTAVAHRMVRGTGHFDIVASDDAIREIVRWLDRATGRERELAPGLDDPRLVTAGVGAALLVLVLPGFGLLLARAAPARPPTGAAGAVELLTLAAALVAALPLIATGSPLPALSIEIADLAVPYLAAAGLATLAGLALQGRLDVGACLAGPGRALSAALVGVLALAWLMAPLGLVFHALTPTVERTVIFVALAALLLPLGLALEGALRRGTLWRGVGSSMLGRGMVIAALAAAVALGALPGVVSLMLPILGGVLIVLELPAAAIRAGGGSVLLGALFQAGMLAWIFAVVLPVRV